MTKLSKKMTGRFAFILFSAIVLATGCTTEIDDDAYRAGAIEIQIDEVTSDEIYPTAGDEIDWKMIFVPSPGDIIVNTFWDAPLEVFNVEVGIYDRFGIPIEVQSRDTGGATGEVRHFTPESGLHFIKVKAESGRSIYSMNVKFEGNYDGFVAPTSAPTFDAYLDPDSELNGKGAPPPPPPAPAVPGAIPLPGGASGGAVSPGGVPGGGGAAAPGGASDGGGVVLPSAAGGGVVLPTAAAGGISSSNGNSGPTIVNTGGGGGGVAYNNEVHAVNQKTAAVSNESAPIKPICADIKGHHSKIEAELMGITPKGKYTQIKLKAGKKDGVHEGAVGDIYVGGQILEGGRFQVKTINDNNCLAITNATSKDIKKATKFVIKSPD